ncbi:MAG: CobQ-like glutamine amidotransferase family enzyme [Pontimonas sp.]|jgi:CobQ-like glutamine amidotransferase family enzyme
MSSFTLARLLPLVLGLNGSAANAEILAQALEHSGHDAHIVDVHSLGDAPAEVDAVCVGSGSASSMRPAAAQLIPLLGVVNRWRSHGAFFVAVGTGWDLLGVSVTTPAGEVLPGAGIFPSEADHRSIRFSGEVAGVDYRGRPSAGYVNQVGAATLHDGVKALMRVEGSESEYPPAEGLIGKGLLATRMGGPALALNPHWCDDILEDVLERRGESRHTREFHDRVANAADHARAGIERRLGVSRG